VADKIGKAVLEITVDQQQYRDALNDVTKQTKKATDEIASISKGVNFLAIKEFAEVAYRGVSMVVQGVVELVERGARVESMRGSFEALSGSIGATGDAMLGTLRSATAGLVSDMDLMAATNKAVLLGLPVTTASMGDLARAATVLGRAMGQDAKKSVDDLTTALGRSSPLILDNLGLSVSVEKANAAYAVTLGKAADKLTDAEKKQAFYNAAMDAARTRVEELGGLHLTFGDRVQQARVVVDQLHDSLSVVASRALTDLTAKFGNMGIGLGDFSAIAKEAMNTAANGIVNAASIGVNAVTGLVQAVQAAGSTIGLQAETMWGMLTFKVGMTEGLQALNTFTTIGLGGITEGLSKVLNPTVTWKDYLAAVGTTARAVQADTTALAAATVKADTDILLSKQELAGILYALQINEVATTQTANAAMAAAVAQARAAMLAAEGAYAVGTMDLATQSGFKTRDELEATAAKALETYNRMAASGLYTTQTLQEAWEAAEKAKQAATEQTSKFSKEEQQSMMRDSLNALRTLFGKSKAGAIALAIADTAAAVVASFKNAGGYPWGLIPAGLMAAAGAKQIATIKSQNFGYAEGTPGLDFAGFGQQTATFLHGQEAVIPRGGGHILAGEIAASLPGAGGDSAMAAELAEIRGALERLPITLTRAWRNAMATA
jgi:hypothetical protein